MKKSGFIAAILCAGLVLTSCGQVASEPQSLAASSSETITSSAAASSEIPVSDISLSEPTSNPTATSSIQSSKASSQEGPFANEDYDQIMEQLEKEAKIIGDNNDRMIAYEALLKEHLTTQDYGYFSKDDHFIPRMVIYAVNMEAVKNAVAQCPNDTIEIAYKKADYSVAYLDGIQDEINALPFVKKSPKKIFEISRVNDGEQYYITIVTTLGSFPELKQWVKNSPYSDIVKVSEIDGSTKTNPA